MKRASLKTAKVPAPPSAANKDVTDRLLDREPAPRPRAKRARPTGAAAFPAPPTEPLPYIPYRTAPQPSAAPPPGPRPKPKPPALPDQPAPLDEPLGLAMARTRAAVESLREAANTAPARFDVAVRYRLDALAHHLEQVTQFLAQRNP
ncbi:MAG: hypothetical protein HYZ35_04170 [Chloroflexi bacterium]|nr:hypothetical protein [Chloroflexota bacterium]MBI3177165.1 hypothetical protein [Chloroflexota bacterium]